MRRVLSVVLAAAVLSSGLAGCSPEETGEPEPAATPSPDGSGSKASDSNGSGAKGPDSDGSDTKAPGSTTPGE